MIAKNGLAGFEIATDKRCPGRDAARRSLRRDASQNRDPGSSSPAQPGPALQRTAPRRAARWLRPGHGGALPARAFLFQSRTTTLHTKNRETAMKLGAAIAEILK